MTNADGVFPRGLTHARLIIAAAIVLAAGLIGAGPAYAHTDFVGSTPADGDTVEGPLDAVSVSFTNPAVPSGEGFDVLGPDGQPILPVSVDTVDGTVFVIRFDPPLTGGQFGVRWNVQAGDAHPISGAFSFIVNDAPPTSTPTTTISADAVAAAPVAPSPTTTIPAATTVASLDEFLSDDANESGIARVGRVGRMLSITGIILGVGALAALLWVIRGRRDELRNVISWIRLAGLAVVAGGVVELAALQATQGVEVGSLIGTKPGTAAFLKIVGGLIVFAGLREDSGAILGQQRSLSAAASTMVESPRSSSTTTREAPEAQRWVPTTSAAFAFTGLVMILASYWFDGHTVSKGPWVIHSFVNFVHLVAAAVWAGGVLAMAAILWQRRRRDEAGDAAGMITRFSSVAAVSLPAVIAAGSLMTFFVLDSPIDLFGTEWGRVLLIKVGAVAVAAGIGAYNHFRLRPALEQNPDDPALAVEFRRTLLVEAGVFLVVIALSAWLVGAAT